MRRHEILRGGVIEQRARLGLAAVVNTEPNLPGGVNFLICLKKCLVPYFHII